MKKWVIFDGSVVFVDDLRPSEYMRDGFFSNSLMTGFFEDEMFDSQKDAIKAKCIDLSEQITELMCERSKLFIQLREID